MRTITLSLLAGAALAMSSNVATAQNGDDIIKKHIEATGGEKAWAKVNSIKLTGNMNIQGMEVPTSRTIVNNKGMRMDFSIMGMECYVIMTPDAGWMYMPVQPGMEEVKEMPKDQVKQAANKLNVRHSMLCDATQISKASYSGMDTLDKMPCYKVAVTSKDGDESTAYFDTKTYYLVRTEVKVKVKDDEEQEVAMSYSNFQKQPEGIVVPMTETNPMMGGDIVYKSIEINKPVAEDYFKPAKKK